MNGELLGPESNCVMGTPRSSQPPVWTRNMLSVLKRSRPWWNSNGNRPQSIVRLSDGCLGLRVTLGAGECVTMPLGRTTLKSLGPSSFKFDDLR